MSGGRCPGNCGEPDGFGTCEPSGECSCTLGWTGVDCSQPTCCPIYVFIGAGTVCLAGVSSLLVWRIFRLRDRLLGRPQPATISPSKSSIRSTGTVTSIDSNASSRTPQSAVRPSMHRSSTGITVASVPTGQDQPVKSRAEAAIEAAMALRQKRASAPAVPTVDEVQTGKPNRDSWAENASHGRPSPAQAEALRATASGQSAQSIGHARSDIGRTAPKAADPTVNKPTIQQPTSMGHTMTDAHSDSTKQSGSIPFRRARTEPLAQRSDDDASSPQVQLVKQKMRDMMDRPLLVRRKTFKELLVEHHPDKNSSEDATEVFQAVNNARSWFLHDS